MSYDLVAAAQGTLDNINLFSCITIISFFLLAPVALLVEGVQFTPAAMRAAGLAPEVVMKQAVVAAVCFHAYQQARRDAPPPSQDHPQPNANHLTVMSHHVLPCRCLQNTVDKCHSGFVPDPKFDSCSRDEDRNLKGRS